MIEGSSILFILILLGILSTSMCFYLAYRIQLHRGIVTDSKIVFLITLLISLIQPLIGNHHYFSQKDYYLLYGMLVLLILIVLTIKFYFFGRTISVYETTRTSLLSSLRKELDNLSILYKEGKGMNDTVETIFDLYEAHATIKVSWSDDSEDIQKINVSFLKWWRVNQFDELQFRLIEAYRLERENKVFWKQILMNVTFGIGILVVYAFMSWNLWRSF